MLDSRRKKKTLDAFPSNWINTSLQAVPTTTQTQVFKCNCYYKTRFLSPNHRIFFLETHGLLPGYDLNGMPPASTHFPNGWLPTPSIHPIHPSLRGFEKFSRRMAKGATTWMSHTNLGANWRLLRCWFLGVGLDGLMGSPMEDGGG